MSRDSHSDVLRGVAAIQDALDLIGSERTDHDLAKVVVDHEKDILALTGFALQQVFHLRHGQ